MIKAYTGVFAAFLVIGGSLFTLSQDFSLPEFSSSSKTEAASVVVGSLGTIENTIQKNTEKFRIFLMPGHEPDFGGAQFKEVIERDVNVEIAFKLKEYLEQDGNFEVVVGRDDNDWSPELGTYFSEHLDEIKAWRDEHKALMKDKVEDGEIDLVDDPIAHEHVSGDVATRLYGVNKWVNEHDFDAAIHVHINDYGSRGRNKAGEFTGYVLYVPESQYGNASLSKEIASSIHNRFLQIFPQSNAKRERGGIIEDQQLVALGRYNTLVTPSVLIEYAYLYESQFENAQIRDLATREYAYQTYLGLKDYFVKGAQGDDAPLELSTLPYEWTKDVDTLLTEDKDIYALQMFLRKQGLYPTPDKTLNDCPISGLFGGCTRKSLILFQEKYNIEGEEGVIGEKTREILNLLGK